MGMVRGYLVISVILLIVKAIEVDTGGHWACRPGWSAGRYEETGPEIKLPIASFTLTVKSNVMKGTVR